MKKLISTLFVLVGLVSFSFAQEASEIAQTNGATELIRSKASGEFVFVLPDNITSKTVETNANYYTSTFTLNFDASSHEADITMLSNEVKDRYVIIRFLTACGVKFIKVDETTMELYDFASKYLE